MRTYQPLLLLALSSPFAFLACSSTPTPPGGSGGAASGGAGSGGAPVGSGGASGGAPGVTGGASSGGTSSGGASSGGTSSGGASSGGSSSGGASSGGSGSGGESGGEFTLTSSALAEGAAFPEENTCAGGEGTMGFGLALPFTWTNPPAGTTHYAMVMLDDTLVGEGSQFGYHSAFWNLPAAVTSLPAEFGATELQGADVINGGYLGPCPSGEDHEYTFTLYALDEEITLGTTLNAAFITTLEAASLGEATLTGTSNATM